MTSSIENNTTLTEATAWTATPAELGTDQVAEVIFSIDGKALWTSTAEPYVFGLDHPIAPRLFPWLVGPGTHEFTVRVVTKSGGSASTSAHAIIGAAPSVPSTLVGTYTRSVTTTDIERTQPLRDESPDEILPTGMWTLHIESNGLISFDDPHGSGGNEAFIAGDGGMLTLMGPANWLNSADRQGAFCELESQSSYQWTNRDDGLQLSTQNDSCADRNALMAGQWARTTDAANHG